MNYVTKLLQFVSLQIKRNKFTRMFYTVHRNENRGLFYVKLEENCKIYLIREIINIIIA